MQGGNLSEMWSLDVLQVGMMAVRLIKTYVCVTVTAQFFLSTTDRMGHYKKMYFATAGNLSSVYETQD
jgi:hypothetical protein